MFDETANWHHIYPTAVLASTPVQSTLGSSHISISWHPRLTGYRFLVISSTAGFGISKAVAAYRGESVASTTLEWTFSVVVSLFLYWLGLYQDNAPATAGWLFERDYAVYIWSFLSICSYPRPTYRTDERSTVMLIKNLHPPITGYRFLVTMTAVCFGLAKAVLSYLGYSAAPNTVDWVFGVLVTISLYWLGLYEASATEVLPALFETDYTSAIVGFGFDAGYNLGYVALHVIAFALFAGWTGVWLNAIVQLWFGKQTESDTDTDESQLVHIAGGFLWSVVACVSVAIGLNGCGAILWSFFKGLPSRLPQSTR
ncbi:hypothetical protein JAAARDRAFT_186087 [Jaapia argillacea MUCL 33604]|uniref:Uncharacterized protein n=1 Tax=Jaapia argillacea MUCL 33604 TaxID=933084 RepID=A0A067PHW1_9AGAM|nr:hypothetical protein JAAARDRAFT_186087 [Jaapia argillacea MUCL 33604]